MKNFMEGVLVAVVGQDNDYNLVFDTDTNTIGFKNSIFDKLSEKIFKYSIFINNVQIPSYNISIDWEKKIMKIVSPVLQNGDLVEIYFSYFV